MARKAKAPQRTRKQRPPGGTDLGLVQASLRFIGSAIADPLGHLGDTTLSAVKQFETRRLGQPGTGQIDRNLAKKIHRDYVDRLDQVAKRVDGTAYVIHGRVVDGRSKIGLARRPVEILDREPGGEGVSLGTVLADRNGWFEFVFPWPHPESRREDAHPDIYFRVEGRDGVTYDSARDVIWNLDKRDQPVFLEIDDGSHPRSAERGLPLPVATALQKVLRDSDSLGEHHTGTYDSETAGALQRLLKRRVGGYLPRSGSFEFDVTFRQKGSGEPLAGRLVRIGTTASDNYVRVPVQSRITDGEGGLRVRYERLKKPPKDHKLRVRFDVSTGEVDTFVTTHRQTASAGGASFIIDASPEDEPTCLDIEGLELAPATVMVVDGVVFEALPTAANGHQPVPLKVEDGLLSDGTNALWINLLKEAKSTDRAANIEFPSDRFSGPSRVVIECTTLSSPTTFEAYDDAEQLIDSASHDAGPTVLQELVLEGPSIRRIEVVGGFVGISKLCYEGDVATATASISEAASGLTHPPCECDACTSALSPAAYFVDLFGFVTSTLGQSDTWVEDRLRQPLASLTLDCSTVEDTYSQLHFANEVLLSFIAERRNSTWRQMQSSTIDAAYAELSELPFDFSSLLVWVLEHRGQSTMYPSAERVTEIYDEFNGYLAGGGFATTAVADAFGDILHELSTTSQSVQEALAADAATQDEFAARLGLSVGDLGFLGKPDDEVLFSDLETGFGLIERSHTTLLFESLRETRYREALAVKLEELLEAMENGDPGAPADEAAAGAAAEAYAAAEALIAEPQLHVLASEEVVEQVKSAVNRVYEAFLPKARHALTFLAHNEARRNHWGLPVIASPGALGDYLHVDLSVDVCQETSRIGFVLETLQDLLLAVQLGKEDEVRVSEFDHDRWAWMKSYGIWHAVQFIFLYPDNFLLPTLRRLGDQWSDLDYEMRRRGWSHFFQEMVDYVDQQPFMNLDVAQAALDLLAGRLSDIQGLRLDRTTGCEDRLYLFVSAWDYDGSVRVYYSVIDADLHWSGWKGLDVHGWALRAPNTVQDLVVSDGVVYVFLLVAEGKKAIFLRETATGEFGLPQEIDGSDRVDLVRAVSIQRTEGWGPTRLLHEEILVFLSDPNAKNNWGFYSAFFVSHIAAGQSQVLEDAKLVLDQYKGLVDVVSYREDRVSFAPEYMQPKGSSVVFLLQVRGFSTENEVGLYGRTSHGNGPNTDELMYEQLTTGDRELNPTGGDWKQINVPVDPLRPGAALAAHDEASTMGGVRTQVVFFDGSSYVGILDEDLEHRNGKHFFYDPLADTRFESIALLPRTLAMHHTSNRFYVGSFDDLEYYGRLLLAPSLGPFYPIRVTVKNRGEPQSGSADFAVSTPRGLEYFLLIQSYTYAAVHEDALAARYLDELFLFAPTFLADRLNEAERFDDALECLAVVYQPYLTLDEAERALIVAEAAVPPSLNVPAWPSQNLSQRFLSQRLHDLASTTPDLEEQRASREYLDNPLLPFGVATPRPFAFARNAVQAYLQSTLDWADEEFARDTPETVPRARELYENAVHVLALDEPQELCDLGFTSLVLPAEAHGEGTASDRVANITRGFCVPANSVREVFQFRADVNLTMIATCRNIAGVKRSLETYSIPVDPAALIEAAAAGLDLDDFVASEPPPLYRYHVLLERARHVVQIAAQFEAHYLSALEKYDDETYTVLRAQNDLRLTAETVSLQNLHLRRANQSVTLAELQVERAHASAEYFQGLLDDGYSLLEELSLGFMITAAAGHAAASTLHFIAAGQGGGYSSSASGSSAAAAAFQTTASIFQTYAAYDRREQEWAYQRDLANLDIGIAGQGVDIALTDVDIAEKQQSIAVLSSQFASDTVQFLSNTQVTNAELFRWMTSELQKLYRQQLNMAHANARAAQQALSFELQEPLSIIGFQYGDIRREGLLGAEELLFDLERLEQHRISQVERKREVTQHLSLSALMPAEFQQFRQTGVLEFTTSSDIFDRSFPGHYQRLIKSVEVSVFALIPPGAGVHATLTNQGISRVMTGAPFNEPVVVQRPPEAVSLSGPSDATGLFELRLDDPMLLPFEGSGLETTWTLEMLRGANRFDFETLFDVVMTIRYTAREDFGYRRKVIDRLGDGFSNTAAISAAVNAPDSWYHFHNPRFTGGPYAFDGSAPLPPYVIELEVSERLLPPNERDRKIRRVVVAAGIDQPMDVPFSLEFVPDTGVAVTATGHAVENGSATLLEFIGQAPIGSWRFALDTSDAALNSGLYNDFFASATMEGTERRVDTSWLSDLLVVIEYEASLQF